MKETRAAADAAFSMLEEMCMAEFQESMKEEKRIKNGYEIIERCAVGEKEIVIGHNPKALNPYVCWFCKDGTDYYWGHYCNQLLTARKKMNERYEDAVSCPAKARQVPSKGKEHHER
jgi:hypothetical protein